MKINLKAIFSNIFTSTDPLVNIEEAEYDQHVDFYYNNLINSLILFSLNEKELEELEGPGFNAMSELEAEIDYAFTSVCFDTLFRNARIADSLKEELLSFKKWTDEIPSEIWDWDFIDTHETWITTRLKAILLLDKLNITNRNYNDDFTTIYDENGNIIKKAKM